MGLMVKGKKLSMQNINDVFAAFYMLEATIFDDRNEYKTDYVMTKLVTVIEQFFRCIVQFQFEDDPTRKLQDITLNPLMIGDIINAVSKKARKVTVGLIVSFSHPFQSTGAITATMDRYGVNNIFSGKNSLDMEKYEELFKLRHELVHTVNPPSKPRLKLIEYHKMAEDLMRHVLGRYEDVGRSFDVLKGIALHEIGINDRAKKCFETALNSYKQAANQKPNDVNVHFNKGVVLLKLEQYDEALVCFDTVIKKKLNNAEALYRKWVALSKLKRYAEALKIMNKIIKICPDDPNMYFNKGLTLFNLKKPKQALNLINKAIMMNLYDADMHISKAQMLLECNRYKEALKCTNKAVEIEPDDAYFHYINGTVLSKLEQYDEALVCFDKACELDLYYDNFNDKGVVLFKLERYGEARDWFENTLSINPNDYLACDYMSRIWSKYGEHEEAKKYADIAKSLKDEHDATQEKS